MIQIKMYEVRKALCALLEIPYKPRTHYYSLPKEARTDPLTPLLFWHGSKLLKIRLLSTQEAHDKNHKKRTRPHRIQIYCSYCNRWLPAGRFVQHSNMLGHADF